MNWLCDQELDDQKLDVKTIRDPVNNNRLLQKCNEALIRPVDKWNKGGQNKETISSK